MSTRHRRHFLKGKEAKSVLSKASDELNFNILQLLKGKVEIEIVEAGFCQVFLLNGQPSLVQFREKILPTLVFEEGLRLLPKAVVDKGAIPNVCNGANVMAPGIVRLEGQFTKGDIVSVAEDKHGKTIAVGEALCNIEVARNLEKGAVVKNIHFVGDKVWNFIKSMKSTSRKD